MADLLFLETEEDLPWCVYDGTGSWEEQGKRHASPRQIVRSHDLVSGSDDSGGGGVRSDLAKILYWHWKAYGSDGRSVARKKKDNDDIPTIIAAFGESYLILSKVALYR